MLYQSIAHSKSHISLRPKLTWIHIHTSQTSFCKRQIDRQTDRYLQPSFSLPSTSLQGTCQVIQDQFLLNHKSFKEKNSITVKAATGTPQRALRVNHLFSSRDMHIPNPSYLTQSIYCQAAFSRSASFCILLNTVSTSQHFLLYRIQTFI